MNHTLRTQNRSPIHQYATVLCGLSASLVLQACAVFEPDLLEPRERFEAMSTLDARDASDDEVSADGSTHEPTPATTDAGAKNGVRARDAQPDARQIMMDASPAPLEPSANDESNRTPDGDETCDDDDAGSLDRDGDGLADCVDACPADPEKSAPGLCGCGHPDSDDSALASCAGLRAALVHRYVFDGTGNVVLDTRGDLDGTAIGAALSGNGSLTLAGDQSDQYVDLPNGILSGLTNATFEAWVSWGGTGDWTRIFDFGDSNVASEGEQGLGASYLMLSPYVNGAETLHAAYADNGPNSAVFVDAPVALPTAGAHHVALVFDDSNDFLSLYLDGMPQGSVLVTGSLSSIRDINNWLGRSQYVRDPELDGTLYEFRIYDAALNDAQLALSFASGPSPAFLAE